MLLLLLCSRNTFVCGLLELLHKPASLWKEIFGACRYPPAVDTLQLALPPKTFTLEVASGQLGLVVMVVVVVCTWAHVCVHMHILLEGQEVKRVNLPYLGIYAHHPENGTNVLIAKLLSQKLIHKL